MATSQKCSFGLVHGRFFHFLVVVHLPKVGSQCEEPCESYKNHVLETLVIWMPERRQEHQWMSSGMTTTSFKCSKWPKEESVHGKASLVLILWGWLLVLCLSDRSGGIRTETLRSCVSPVACQSGIGSADGLELLSSNISSALLHHSEEPYGFLSFSFPRKACWMLCRKHYPRD